MEGYMSARKVTHEIKLPLSLTIILGVIAFGLLANVFKPVFSINKAFAAGEVHKIALCDKTGEYCAGVTKGRNGFLMVTN
jgi:hypothetical protein